MNVSGLKNICLTSWQTHHCCWQVQIICKINGISTALLQLYNFIWNLRSVTSSAAFKIKRLQGLALRRPPVAQGYSVQLGQGWEGSWGEPCLSVSARASWHGNPATGRMGCGCSPASQRNRRTAGTERCCLRQSHCREQTIVGDPPGVCVVSQIRSLLNWLLCTQFFSPVCSQI